MSRRWSQFSIRSLLLAVLLCAVAVRFWPVEQADPPDAKWQEMFYDNAPPLTNIPAITLTASDGSITRVNVKNVGDTTLQYYSAGPEHISLFQEINLAGKWTKSNWDWCGTGKELFEIAPHDSADLVVSFWDNQQRERMLANFSEKGTNRAGLVVLATEPPN